jgi:hypothetical protein
MINKIQSIMTIAQEMKVMSRITYLWEINKNVNN